MNGKFWIVYNIHSLPLVSGYPPPRSTGKVCLVFCNYKTLHWRAPKNQKNSFGTSTRRGLGCFSKFWFHIRILQLPKSKESFSKNRWGQFCKCSFCKN